MTGVLVCCCCCGCWSVLSECVITPQQALGTGAFQVPDEPDLQLNCNLWLVTVSCTAVPISGAEAALQDGFMGNTLPQEQCFAYLS